MDSACYNQDYAAYEYIFFVNTLTSREVSIVTDQYHL